MVVGRLLCYWEGNFRAMLKLRQGATTNLHLFFALTVWCYDNSNSNVCVVQPFFSTRFEPYLDRLCAVCLPGSLAFGGEILGSKEWGCPKKSNPAVNLNFPTNFLVKNWGTLTEHRAKKNYMNYLPSIRRGSKY